MKIYLVTLNKQSSDIIDEQLTRDNPMFIGDFVEKVPIEDIKDYVDVNDE